MAGEKTEIIATVRRTIVRLAVVFEGLAVRGQRDEGGLGGLNQFPLRRQNHIRGGHGKLAVLKSRLILLGRGNFPTLEVMAAFLRFITGNRNRDVFRIVSVFYRLPVFPVSAIQIIADRIELRPLGRQHHIL